MLAGHHVDQLFAAFSPFSAMNRRIGRLVIEPGCR
jgi:hypothetical protein